jgi:hypothetical protein
MMKREITFFYKEERTFKEKEKCFMNLSFMSGEFEHVTINYYISN